MKGISYLIIGLALVGLAVAGTLSQQGGVMTWNGQKVFVAETDNTFDLQTATILAQSTHRKMYGPNHSVTVTVKQDGTGNYTTIQDALNNVPIKLNERWYINIYNGTYDEDIVIHYIIGGGTDSTEGDIAGLRLNGQTDINGNYPKVKSVKFSNCYGAIACKIEKMEIYGIEPTTDEFAQISIYGSQEIEIKNSILNRTNTSTVNGVVAYGGSTVYLSNLTYINGSTGSYAKHQSIIQIGDCGSDSGVKGELHSLANAQIGSYISIQCPAATYNRIANSYDPNIIMKPQNTNNNAYTIQTRLYVFSPSYRHPVITKAEDIGTTGVRHDISPNITTGNIEISFLKNTNTSSSTRTFDIYRGDGTTTKGISFNLGSTASTKMEIFNPAGTFYTEISTGGTTTNTMEISPRSLTNLTNTNIRLFRNTNSASSTLTITKADGTANIALTITAKTGNIQTIGNYSSSALTGTGNAFACINSDGVIYRSNTSCS